jgi:hypothetical protein
MGRGGGMVDTLDSKSGVSNDVPVQIRLAVPQELYKKALFEESFLYRFFGWCIKSIYASRRSKEVFVQVVL